MLFCWDGNGVITNHALKHSSANYRFHTAGDVIQNPAHKKAGALFPRTGHVLTKLFEV
jgi:hypothetical protein